MNENIKFSIIMPVYGVEKFINKSIQSIINQTYKNYEVILVDDCTKDNSGEICKEYSNKYENIIYKKHKVNKGLSAARNTGIEYAKGDYILFLDSDDYFENNMLEIIYKSLQKNMADVVIYSFSEEYMKNEEEIQFTKVHKYNSNYFSDIEFRKIIIELERETLYGYAWNKAYKKKIIKQNNLQFKKINHIEDIDFNIKYFNNIDSLNILEDTLYHYVQHNGQRLTTKKVDGYFELQKKRINFLIEQHKRWNIYNDNVKEILSIYYFRYFLSAIQRLISENIKSSEIKKFVETEMHEDIFLDLRKYCKTNNIILRILYSPLKNKKTSLTILVCKIINFTKEKLPNLFSILKQYRK